MIELVREGGWVMLPLILCSVIALGIILERFWSLRVKRVCPEHLLAEVWPWVKTGNTDPKRLEALRRHSPLGQILAAGLQQRSTSRDLMKEAIEDTGRHVVHELERYLNSLGTIAAITPLLGLLGTVTGMINTFGMMTLFGNSDPKLMSGGISEALVTTQLGLCVAIPILLLHHFLERPVDGIVADMEEKSVAFSVTLLRNGTDA